MVSPSFLLKPNISTGVAYIRLFSFAFLHAQKPVCHTTEPLCDSTKRFSGIKTFIQGSGFTTLRAENFLFQKTHLANPPPDTVRGTFPCLL